MPLFASGHMNTLYEKSLVVEMVWLHVCVRCRGFIHLQSSDVKTTGCDTGMHQLFSLGKDSVKDNVERVVQSEMSKEKFVCALCVLVASTSAH